MTRGLPHTLLAFTLLLTLGLVAGLPVASAQAASVHVYLFYSNECEECQAIKADFLPGLLAQYGETLEINQLEIGEPSNFELMVALEQAANVAPEDAAIPEVFIGQHALMGAEAVRSGLPALIDRYLAQGGVELPTPTPSGGRPVARFLLFYGETCPHCHEVMDNFLPGVYEKYGDQVEYRYIEVWSNPDDYLTLLALETKLGVPEDRQGSVPVLVIGDKVLIGAADIPARLEDYIDEYLAQGGVDFPSLEDLPEVVLPTPEPSVQFLAIFDQNHAEFEALNQFIIALGQKYGSGIRAYALDVSSPESADLAAKINEALDASVADLGEPEILVDRRILVGMNEIMTQLPGLIDQYLAQGGLALPAIDDLVAGATPTPQPATPAPTPTLGVIGSGGGPVRVLYLFKTGCQECDRAGLDLNYIEKTYEQVQITKLNIEDEQSLAWWLGKQLGVPEDERLDSPALFIGSDHLTSDQWTLVNVQALVEKYSSTGSEAVWEQFDGASRAEAERELKDRYRLSWQGVLTVLGAGLVNGLNPCAFVTIVFFLSYLTFMGRRGREVLIVGAMFTAGVFVAYLLAGLGLNQLMEPLAGVQAALKRWVFGFTALLCLALAGISLHDYIKARQGKTDEMKLKLSLDLRRRVNRVIRQGVKMRAFYAVAFGVGALVSLIQLTCTSPIYIGILFVIHEGAEMQANAYLYLLLFNLAYIVPLVAIFVLAYFGTTSEQLGDFITSRTAAIKLLTLVVFLVLFGWLVYSLVPLMT